LNNASYFQKLMGSVTRIARHSFYPGKEEAVELCLEEIQDLRDSGRINSEQLATLRELLLGEETFCLVEGVIREREHTERIPSQDRIALVCQGTGSHAAFTAGVLQGLLEQAGDYGQIAALAGTSFGSLCALLAWDGLLRGGPRQAVDQLEGFWRDYAATSLVDALLNYWAQMVLHFRAMVPLPVLGLHEVTALGPDQLRRLLERRVDFAVARSLAARPGAPGLVVGTADTHGGFEVCRGPEVSAETMQAATGVLPLGPAAILETRPRSEGPSLPGSPIREVARFKPSEIWLIQVNKVGCQRSPAPAVHSLDPIELASKQVLEQELRFIHTINTLLTRGTLIDGGYRPIEVHRIIMEHDLDDASKLDRSSGFLSGLMSYGRERAVQFLEKREQRLSSRAESGGRAPETMNPTGRPDACGRYQPAP
jgi:NTE family protein